MVVVFGAGPVGLFAAKSAWLMGAGRVIVIDHLEYRLEKARSFAHAETFNFTEYDDIVVEMKKTDRLPRRRRRSSTRSAPRPTATSLQHVTAAKLKLQGGSPVALNWAIDSVRKGGTVSVMGAYGPMFSAVKFGDAMNKGLTLRMNQCPVKRQWPRLFEHIRNGYLKPSDIVTHRIPLEHIAEGYHIFSAKLDDCIKPLDRPERRLRRSRDAVHRREAAAAPRPATSCAPASPAGAPTSTRRTGPSVPQERFDPDATGAHWDFPERQPEKWPRERSIEHKFLTPVFGTSCPPKGLSGAIRKLAYRRYSEGRAAHWLLLLAGRPGRRRSRATCGRSLTPAPGQPDHRDRGAQRVLPPRHRLPVRAEARRPRAPAARPDHRRRARGCSPAA